MVRVVWMMVSACKTGRRAHNTRHTAFPENGPTFPENVNANHPQGRAAGLQILQPRPPAVVAGTDLIRTNGPLVCRFCRPWKMIKRPKLTDRTWQQQTHTPTTRQNRCRFTVPVCNLF